METANHNPHEQEPAINGIAEEIRNLNLGVLNLGMDEQAREILIGETISITQRVANHLNNGIPKAVTGQYLAELENLLHKMNYKQGIGIQLIQKCKQLLTNPNPLG